MTGITTKKRFIASKTSMLALLVVSTMVFTACSSKSEPAANGSNNGKAAEGKKVTLKVEIFDRGNAPAGSTITENYLSKLVQEKFGDTNNVKVEYVPVPRSEEVAKLNVLMASGSDVPDIVFTYDPNTFNRYAKQGGLTDLGPLLEAHGQTLKTFLGDEVLQYGKFEGTQYAIPAKRSNTGKYASFIREDWLTKLNMPVPQTTAELYETLKAFKEKDPGQTGGQVIPLGMTIASAQYEPLLWSFIQTMTEEQQYTLTQQLGSNDYPILLPGFKDGLQFMNKLYNEGLISKDFGLDKDKKKMSEDIQTGKVGFFSEDDINIYYKDGTYDLLQKTVEGAVLSAVDVYTNDQGKHAKPQYAPNGLYIMVPKSSKNAVEAVKYLNWMASDDNLFNLQNGVLDENYSLVDGIPVANENPTEEAKNRLFNSGDLAIISNGKQLGSLEKNLQARALSMPKQFQEQLAIAQEIAYADTIPLVMLDRPIEAQTKYATTLLDKFNEIIVKTTMAKPDQFESIYTTMLKDYMASGGQAILDERIAAYNEMKSK
ncbi:putative aldouronate transport system substrate-binding protein [Paenibacillus endophyticus]|uniref:Putative aldouronate transport system substrate-binding protein n=1 Tax=Paenibacillus endophyticus TaxID=1294268 RepID=A0A7W5C7S0_9BACL|nr:extracellular solute-binding protein [Paenibacillus endophyticus]MBB3152309.1 putative aldouronate transport system substrate-binding protein [Paenibacillus endophyticus]